MPSVNADQGIRTRIRSQERSTMSKEKKRTSTISEPVTMAWLYRNVPMTLWSILWTIIFSAFILGVTVGQTTFVKEIVGVTLDPEIPPITNDPQRKEIDLLITQLTRAHNENVAILQSEIIKEEKQAANDNLSTSDQESHAKAAQRLRNVLDEANVSYRKNIGALRDILKQ